MLPASARSRRKIPGGGQISRHRTADATRPHGSAEITSSAHRGRNISRRTRPVWADEADLLSGAPGGIRTRARPARSSTASGTTLPKRVASSKLGGGCHKGFGQGACRSIRPHHHGAEVEGEEAAMRRGFRVVILALVVILAGLVARPAWASTPQLPNSMAAVGDSITRAYDVCCYGDHPG